MASGFSGLPKLRLSVSASGVAPTAIEIAPGFGDRLLAALERIGLAIALVDVGGQRQPLGPVAEPDHRRVAAGALHGVAEDQRSYCS